MHNLTCSDEIMERLDFEIFRKNLPRSRRRNIISVKFENAVKINTFTFIKKY